MSDPGPDRDRAFFGHPIGLSTLFFTEMWERFSYYGMRAFLFFFMTGGIEHGGRGMTRTSAGVVMALYTASVYMLSLPGGWVADRFLGQRRAVIYGGVAIAAGNIMLTLPAGSLFYPGLVMIAVGTGLLKPNVSTIVGQLYAPDDVRRSAGFTIYYMGINIGATAAPLVCAYLAQTDSFRELISGWGFDPNMCWRFAFGATAIGMIGGVIQYLLGWSKLGDAGLHPTVPADPKVAARDVTIAKIIVGSLLAIVALAVVLIATGVEVDGDTIGNIFGIGLAVGAIVLFYGMLKSARDAGERTRVIAMIPLFLGAIAFFATFEQASTTLNLYADRFVARDFVGLSIPSSVYQSVNGVFIVLLAPVFAWIWLRLAKKNREPTSVNKFGIGMVLGAIAFVVLVPTISRITHMSAFLPPDNPTNAQVAAYDVASAPFRINPTFLITLYLFQTLSELCISPVGLSSMSKLAPVRMAGMVMGTWFLATSIGNYLAGRAAGFTATRGFGFLFWTVIIASFVVAAALFAVAPMMKRMFAAEEGTPPPAELPGAVVVESRAAGE